VTTAPLLGTAGLYLEDQVFGLVADGVVYFRTDAHSEDRYDASGSRRFCYDMHAGHMAPTRYREVPQHVLECQDLTCAWAYEALATERW
jgi:TfoX/Sxy family transcriptional regulator of competence genes